jgi:DnaD/phage-associated family protein
MRKRMLDPEFFTDSDIIANFDFAGRLFYQGLWCVADDSGCFAIDALSLKMKIFPGDNIELSAIQQYLDKLIDINKIIPYEANGKRYGWIKNFIKHQKLDRPSPPTIPLPPFIIWHDEAKERHKWYYEVIDISNKQQRQFDDTSATSQRMDIERDTIEEKRKEEKRKEGEEKGIEDRSSNSENPTPHPPQENDNSLASMLDSPEVKQIVSFYEHNFGALMSPIQLERITAFLDDGMETALITETMSNAVMANIYDLRYVERALISMQQQGIYTLQQYKEHEAKRDLAKKKAAIGNQGTRAAPVIDINKAAEKAHALEEDQVDACATFIKLELGEIIAQGATDEQIQEFLYSSKFDYGGNIREKALRKLGLEKYIREVAVHG